MIQRRSVRALAVCHSIEQRVIAAIFSRLQSFGVIPEILRFVVAPVFGVVVEGTGILCRAI